MLCSQPATCSLDIALRWQHSPCCHFPLFSAPSIHVAADCDRRKSLEQVERMRRRSDMETQKPIFTGTITELYGVDRSHHARV